MEVILTQRLPNLGNIGDTVTVKNGYARNYLLPQNKALRATKDNVAYFESKRAEIEKRNEDARKDAEKASKAIDGAVVTLIRQASDDGRLYGSVSARDIAGALREKGNEGIHRQHVALNVVIKEIGIYPVDIELHPEVKVGVKVVVARSESEAKEALKGKAPKKAEPKPAVEEESSEAEDVAETAEATDEGESAA